jgi:transposase
MVAGTRGSLNKAGSTKMTETNTLVAGIDAAKAKLDVAVHGRTLRWQVDNELAGWQRLAAVLAEAGMSGDGAKRRASS